MNNLFWDSSAFLPVLLQERMTPVARKLWLGSQIPWAWNWMAVEVESALTRRNVDPSAWERWKTFSKKIQFISLQPEDYESLRLLNRSIGLRAADAGHLFLYEKLTGKIPNLQLVSFDRELSIAARRLGLMLHAECLH